MSRNRLSTQEIRSPGSIFQYIYIFIYPFLTMNALSATSLEPTCNIKEQFEMQGLYKKGDIIIGGIFEVSFKAILPDLSFHSKPERWKCESLDFSTFQWALTVVLAIEEINRDQSLLPNITLGYRLYDNCMKLQVALRAAVTLIAGLENTVTDYNCEGLPPVVAMIGDPLSSHSIAISRVLGLFRIPMISYYATCSCLSNKREFPSFFRTVPSDAFQVKALVQIIKHYRWTWVGVVASDDDYGQYAVKSFHEEMSKFGCVAFSETLPIVNARGKILQIVNIIKQSTAKIIVIFSTRQDATALIQEIVHQNITGRQWIASEAWSTSTFLATKENFPSFGGTIGTAIRRGEIPGMKDFLLKIRPDFAPSNNLLLKFWETMFECQFMENITNLNNSYLPDSKQCTGLEDLNSKQTSYTDVTESRASYNIYKAVYALAHALNNLASCKNGKGPFENSSCASVTHFQPWQLMHYLKTVNFTSHLGERVAFDENGDALAIYDIVNWQMGSDGNVEIKTVGIYDKAAGTSQEIFLKEDMLFWNFPSGTFPESICSKSCQPGTRKATRKGEPICCFDCIPCADGEISSHIDSIECVKCPSDFWSNSEKTQCVVKEIEFLSYEDVMGITLTTTALFGSCLSFSVLGVFLLYRSTPVVKANNSELSFLLLIALNLCFLCSLCFIGQPSQLTCGLRHVLFGISFALCISCILVKTLVVIMVFKATLPGNNAMKWFGAAQQRGTVFIFTCIQSLICIIWLTTAPPVPAKNTNYQNTKIILECNVGSLMGFGFLLGYIGILACVCFILAFLARNLPDNFNEAKFITFSMLIFCAVWITFIPAYISSPGKYTVAVEIFAILASSFGVLIAIFAPKCYIILFKPEENTKKALMGRAVTSK
ncbi:extracellular calcium-sensing receptor-like [Polypterus senegalus]|uniref:extracellular calcium-sensing receptor-like n=1 Tax=Polypterus senegalus TaxID=55291 RepID=UPI0019660157|nr:extracellular calcium-sensing receptor-like [Polypterus senegalus]